MQAYQVLFTISEAYHVSVDRILALNGLQADWPLQIGQKLLISPGNVTPSPTLSAIQKLTPEADGNYYHTVQSGETLFWIAGLYDVSLIEPDGLEWTGCGIRDPPGTKIAAARHPACNCHCLGNADSHPQPGTALAKSVRDSVTNGNSACC